MTASQDRVELATPAAAGAVQTGEAADRRSFLKTTAAATTAVAVTGLVAPAAAAQAGQGKLSGVVSARFNPKRKPTAKQLHAVLDRILDLHGCTACGLLGIDVRLFLDMTERVDLGEIKVPVEVTRQRVEDIR